MRLALLLLLTATSLRANALADLQGTLQRLPGHAPVAATIEFAFADSTGDEKKPVTTEGRAVAAVALDAEGLRIRWSPEQLAAAMREQGEGAGKPNAPAPTLQAMGRLGAPQIHDYLNASRGLLHRLETATLLGEHSVDWNKQAARLLTFKIEPPLSDEDKKVIKEIDATAKVWIAADGTPLAAESTLRLKGRVMMVIGFEHTEKEQFTFACVGDRLVVTAHQREAADDGGGQHARGRSTATLHLADGQ
jgi:hypothetical protein